MKTILIFALVCILVSCSTPREEADLIIRNAQVVDGTGDPSFYGNVVVRGGNIIYIGEDSHYAASTEIDAGGKVLTPGFIDPHAHGNPLSTPEFQNFLSQGVTTILLGQDGSGPDPASMEDWFTRVDSLDLGPNVATLIGHGSLRRSAGVPTEIAPDSIQLKRMIELLMEGMSLGAYGMSTGLEYIPGYYAKENELFALAKTVGFSDGVLMSHMRNEDDLFVNESVRELVRQGTFCRVQVSHLKVVYGKGQARAKELLSIIDSARNSGIDIYADVYPYTASYTGIGIVFPDFAKRPNDYDQVRKEKREELFAFIAKKVTDRNGPESTLFGTRPWSGMTLAEVADSLNKHFADVLIDDIGPGGGSAAYFVMDEELQEHLLSGKNVMVCTDGSPTMRHPRGYGSFAKVIEDYVVRKKLLTLEEAIHKMTGLPAKSIGFPDRGTIGVGMKADMLLFDPEEIRAVADFENPFQLSQGFNEVIINGKVIRSGGEPQGIFAGELLRK